MEQLSKRMEISGISKTFFSDKGYFTVIKDVSFDVSNGESLVILGPGRCGRIVLFNIITGLEQRAGGAVVYNGRKWKGVDPEISMVFRKLALMPLKTVVKNMEPDPRFRGMSKGQRRELARHYIKLMDLKGFEESYPAQLSGNMKQRVGVTRAYTADPELLIMDKPFGQLDARTRYQMQEEILRIWGKKKRTVIFVTNNIEEACYLRDRIILLSGCPATIKEIYPISISRPRDMISEEFLNLRTIISDDTDLVT